MENRGLRILAKTALGTVSGVAVATFSSIVLIKNIDFPEKDNGDDPWGDELGLVLFGSLIGCGVGFPLGVTWADPHDSNLKTLFGGVIPVAAGYILAVADEAMFGPGLFLMYVAPFFSSVIVSEKSRNPPEKRLVSFGLSPAPHGGLYAAAKLRF